MDTSTLISRLSGRWREVIKTPIPPTNREIAWHVFGGSHCREVLERKIQPMLSEHSRGGSKYHLIIVGERGNGKSHWCYVLERMALEMGMDAIYISARNDLREAGLIEYLSSRKINVGNVERPTVVILDEVDELVIGDTSSTRLRDKLKADLMRIIDLADSKPIMLVLALLPRVNFDRIFDLPVYSKLFRTLDNININELREPFKVFGRAAILYLDYFWKYGDRADFLADVILRSIRYELRNDPLGSQVSHDAVKRLLDNEIWKFAASLPTLNSALNILKTSVFPMLDTLKRPLSAGDIRLILMDLLKKIEENKQSYYRLPVRSKMERVARNLAIALARLRDGAIAFDQRIPPTRSGWAKVSAIVNLKGGRRIALKVPLLDKALYIANRKRLTEQLVNLVEKGFVDEVWVFVPVTAESKARGLISDRKLAEKINEGRIRILSINDQELNTLISDLEAVEWYLDEYVKDIVDNEIRGLKDIWGKSVSI